MAIQDVGVEPFYIAELKLLPNYGLDNWNIHWTVDANTCQRGKVLDFGNW
jgi:hypothetical protein